MITVGGLRDRHPQLRGDGRRPPVELARKEFELLLALARRAGEVVTKRDLLSEVWQLAWGGSDRTVDVHLSWLRRKLGETAAEPRYLHSVRGVGVRLVGTVAEAGGLSAPRILLLVVGHDHAGRARLRGPARVPDPARRVGAGRREATQNDAGQIVASTCAARYTTPTRHQIAHRLQTPPDGAATRSTSVTLPTARSSARPAGRPRRRPGGRRIEPGGAAGPAAGPTAAATAQASSCRHRRRGRRLSAGRQRGTGRTPCGCSPSTMSSTPARPSGTCCWPRRASGCSLIGIVAGELLTRRIIRPLVRTAETAQQLSVGDTTARAPTDGPREVADVGKALNRLADRIDELIAEERETVADLSHRLRTPLTALRLDAEALRDPAEAERVGGHVSALERTLTAVIHAARRPQREGRMPSCDATAVVRRAGRVLVGADRGPGPARRRRRCPSAPLPVRAAAEDLAAAVDALLENVVAHTPEGDGVRACG